ncbi:MAG: hypothetical protein BMS9Abin01_0572 [Gammaproteobacteria bacterium]|nr:MAG: hypothetical protein BMS9Abin01_0572 [Gammaproteobacteria bacterium]
MRAGKAIASGVALVALVAGAGAVAVSRVDPEAVRDFLTDIARQATGREVLVRGATELRLLPSPTLIAENVVFGNAPWSVSPDMARVKRLEARLSFFPLFLGQLRVTRFRLLEPHVLLERDSKGRRNWDFEVATESSTESSGDRNFLAWMQSRVRLVVSGVEIVDGTFRYRDGNNTRTIRIPNLSADGDVAGGPLKLAGRGQFNGRVWKLSGRVGELSTLLRNQPYDLALVLSTQGTRLTGEGIVERPLDGAGLRMDLKLNARSGRQMLAVAGFDLDLPGAVQASATLTDLEGSLRLDQLRADAHIEAGHITASGSVKSLVSLRGVNLELDVKAKSLAGISRLSGIDLPAAGPVTATARITNPKGRYRLDKLSARIGLRGATLNLGGKLADLARGRGLDLGIELQAASLARLSRYLGVPLPAVGPVKVRGRLSRTRRGYKLAKLDARVGRSDAGGELFIYPHRKRPRVVGSLKAKNLDLDQLLPGTGTGTRRGRRIFSAEPFSLAWLNAFDADVSVHARKLHIRGVRLDKVKVGMSLAKGRLLFTPAGRLGGGRFNARLSVDARATRPRIAMRVRGKGIGLGKVSAQIYGTGLIEGARADLNIDVAGRGNSVAALMAGLSGGIYVAAGKAVIDNQRLENISGDVVTAVLGTVAMQSAEDKTTHVRCGVVRVLVRDGLVSVDRSIAMETSRAAMSVSGSIDLRDEGLDLGIDLAGRRGPSLGAGSFSGLVRVRGTIAEPKVVADAAGIVGVAATVAGAVATGGLSLIAQGLISQIAADRSTCRTALEIDTTGGSGTVAFNNAGSRDSEDFEPATRPRKERRNATPVEPQSEFARRTEDGN